MCVSLFHQVLKANARQGLRFESQPLKLLKWYFFRNLELVVETDKDQNSISNDIETFYRSHFSVANSKKYHLCEIGGQKLIRHPHPRHAHYRSSGSGSGSGLTGYKSFCFALERSCHDCPKICWKKSNCENQNNQSFFGLSWDVMRLSW